MLGQPTFRWRFDQRLDGPGLPIDLLGRLQRVAAVHEQGRLIVQHDCEPRLSRKTAEPGQPLFRRRDVLVLLLIGPRDNESPELPPCQLLAQRFKSRAQGRPALSFLKCLKTCFEHPVPTLGLRGELRNAKLFWHRLCLKNASRVRPIAAYFTIDFIGLDGGNAGSAPAQRRGERACLLSRLRRFRLPAAPARLIPSRKSSVVRSFRSWIDLSKHVSSAHPAMRRTRPSLLHR